MRFTVHRPASAEVSPCCHRPSGGDVACSVHVSVARPRTAGGALENRLTLAIFSRDMPALGASLRRIRCWDKFKPPQRFVLQPGDQQSPPSAADLTIEAPFLRHVGARAFTTTARRLDHGPHLQVLDADGVEPTRQIGGELLHPVTPPVCFAATQPRNGQLRSSSPVRSASRPGQPLLQSAQPLGFTSAKAGSVQQLPSRQRSRHCHAAINTDYAAITRSRNEFRDGSKSDMPTPRPIQGDAIGLHSAGDVAGPPEPHPSDLRYPHLPVAAAESLDVTLFEPDLPKSFMRAGLTPRRAPVCAIEKVAHRLREVAQRLLLHGLRPSGQPAVFGAGRSQLGTLLVIARRLAAWLPVLVLLHGQIPHKPGVPTMLGQHCRLLEVRKQPESAHSNNVSATTDNLPKDISRS